MLNLSRFIQRKITKLDSKKITCLLLKTFYLQWPFRKSKAPIYMFHKKSLMRSGTKLFYSNINLSLLFTGSMKVEYCPIRKQSLADVLQNMYSSKFCKIYRKTSVLESLFNEVEGLNTCNFIKKRLQHECFPVNFCEIFKITFLQNICSGSFCL